MPFLVVQIAPPPLVCDYSTDLLNTTSPLSGTTSGGSDTHGLSCGGAGNEAMFEAVLQPGEAIDIGMDSNAYDSRHETRWGGDCPGDNVVTCTDDPDTRRHRWINDQREPQTVFFAIDAYSSGAGDYVLSWTFPVPAGTPLTHGGGSFCTDIAPCPACTGDCDNDGQCQGNMTCGQRSSGDPAPRGCRAGGAGDVNGHDYCIEPLVNLTLVHGGGSHCTTSEPCPTCTGDCDNDSQCQFGLVCHQRGSGDPAPPGCAAGGAGDVNGHDYCVNP